MLGKKTETRNIQNYSVINGENVCQFYANIDSEAPQNMDIGRTIYNKELYKTNRVQVMKDQAEFETYAYSFQDEMIAANQPAESETNE
ncbi:Uncharacterised protein [Eubacterium limosum]|uniref:Uncharacterized protein n=1 Tax=Eubacterium limosum TaxID=1736 RepID=A0A6N3FNB5_EUBLI